MVENNAFYFGYVEVKVPELHFFSSISAVCSGQFNQTLLRQNKIYIFI